MTIQFKIQIRDIKKPPVWRRIIIPDNFTFHDLHITIQSIFKWYNKYPYQFQRYPFNQDWLVRIPDEEYENMRGFRSNDARKTNVIHFIKHTELKKFVYVYGFRDSWIHDITVEEIDTQKQIEHPICLAGKSASPSELYGGAETYEEVKLSMDKDAITMFNLEDTNAELANIRSDAPSFNSIKNVTYAQGYNNN